MSISSANPPEYNRRRQARYAIAVPVDITVLRSGVPDAIPGRTVNFGEGGMAAVMAGELRTGDAVGIEVKLQGAPEPLLAKAVVRHHQALRCGLEFQHLSPDQREIIRYWSGRSEPLRPFGVARVPVMEPAAHLAPAFQPPRPASRFRPLFAISVAAILLAVFGIAWQWHRGWQELESHIDQHSVAGASVAQVPSSEVEHLVLHKVDPVYPEDAKRANLQGVVVLATVIGRDGSVEKVRPVSGPDVLASAAMEAVRWWRFQPYLINGKAVEIETTLAVEFRL